MKLDCVLVGFHDEDMENIIRRVVSKKESSASYNHYLARSIDCYGKRLKFSEAFNEAISISTGISSDLTIYRMPNLALHYLRKYLMERDIKVGLVNYFNDGKENLVSLIKEGHPLVVGISSTCQVEADPLREIVDLVKKTDKSCITVIGGPLINSLNFEYNGLQQDYMYRLLGADIFIHERQGQRALYDIISSIKNKGEINCVNNIIYKDGGHYVRTQKVPENISLDESPTKDFTFYKGHPLPPVYVQTGLSCQLNCAFCRYPILSGDPCYMSLDGLKENFDYIKSLGVSCIIFVDDSLNIPLDRFKKILRMMIKEKYNFTWYSFFRISHSDEEIFDLMKESGCKGVILGVESGCNTILKNMDKQVSSEKLEWGINQLSKRNIISHASCMIGFPGETKETARQTIEFIKRAKPTFYDIQTWYYENAVPISKEKKYYKLEGYGYNWKHKDMDSKTAGNLVIDAIKEIDESCFMPSLSFNLWSLGYYLTQGVNLNEVTEFCHLFKELVGDQTITESYNDTLNKLLHVFRMNKELYNNLNSREKNEKNSNRK